MKKLALACMVTAALSPILAQAHQAGDFILRSGSITVRPNEGSQNVLGTGSFSVGNNTQLGLTAAYMVTNNFGVELLAATPFTHKVSLNGVGNLASVKQLPPTLMAQWYFDTRDAKLTPYLGLGLNYTGFFSEKFNNNPAVEALGLKNLKASDSWGVAAQAGLDYKLGTNWLLNTSVWWINIENDVSFDTANLGHQEIKTRLDPFVFMFGAGYSF